MHMLSLLLPATVLVKRVTEGYESCDLYFRIAFRVRKYLTHVLFKMYIILANMSHYVRPNDDQYEGTSYGRWISFYYF